MVGRSISNGLPLALCSLPATLSQALFSKLRVVLFSRAGLGARHSCANGVPIVRIALCKRPTKHFTSDNTSPNTNPKTLTTLNLSLNGRKEANIISHSKFLPKVVGWLGMWRTTISLGPRLHILAKAGSRDFTVGRGINLEPMTTTRTCYEMHTVPHFVNYEIKITSRYLQIKSNKLTTLAHLHNLVNLNKFRHQISHNYILILK